MARARGGADTLAHALGTPPADAGILGTVAPQHMYGFETTIMFPLQCGARLLPVRPALPGDVVDAMRVARSLGITRAWLFTTPLQLRAFHAAAEVAGVERVVTATMPLDPALALRIEHDWNARVDEIYGCTEGGTLAFRRPTRDDIFAAGEGIHFAIDEGGRAAATGRHLPRPVPLADRIELVEPFTATASRKIRLLGRDDDLVKVGGQASLARRAHGDVQVDTRCQGRCDLLSRGRCEAPLRGRRCTTDDAGGDPAIARRV